MRTVRIVLVGLVALLFVANAMASGPIGIFGIVDRIVFEPNDAEPERLQVWGVFAFADTTTGGTLPAEKGYMYFRLPATDEGGTPATLTAIKKEWADLKSVAGTGQPIGFGGWLYTGGLDSGHYYQRAGPSYVELTVHPDSQKIGVPAVYSTNLGIVKLSAASHSSIIDELKRTLRGSGK